MSKLLTWKKVTGYVLVNRWGWTLAVVIPSPKPSTTYEWFASGPGRRHDTLEAAKDAASDQV